MVQVPTRRSVLRLLAGASLLAFHPERAVAGRTGLIERLIGEARTLPHVARRIDLISGRLLGIRYQANTLIGGPNHPEKFVVRDDAFDCVTFCEVVLAAALARDLADFEASLRRIRYEHGEVKWEERNHYFSDWSRRVVEKDICHPVGMEPSTAIEKTVNWGNLGRRRISMVAIPRSTFWANRTALAAGDIIGFVSKRSNLDFYHTGLVAFDKKGDVVLRHASRRRRRIVDESMRAFFAANGVQHVTLLRATDDAAVAGRT